MNLPAKRDRLIEAANCLLAEGKDVRPSIAQVADKAALPLPIALQDVGDIETLLRLVALQHLQIVHAKINAALQRSRPREWAEVLQILLEQAMRYGIANPAVVPLFLSANGWHLVKDEIMAAEDEMTRQMADLLPAALWAPIAKLDRGLNPFRLVVDMIITVLQHGYRENGALDADTLAEAKRVALRYLKAIEAEAQAL